MADEKSKSEELEELEKHHLHYHHRLEVRRTVLLSILTVIVSILLITQVF